MEIILVRFHTTVSGHQILGRNTVFSKQLWRERRIYLHRVPPVTYLDISLSGAKKENWPPLSEHLEINKSHNEFFLIWTKQYLMVL